MLGSRGTEKATLSLEELKVQHLSLLKIYVSAREKNPTTPTQPPPSDCLVQRSSVPTEYVDCHVTLAYPRFKAEIKLVTQFLHAFQIDTKSQAEPLLGHSLVCRTRSQRWGAWLPLRNSPRFPRLSDLCIFPHPQSQMRLLPSEDSSGDAWEKQVQPERDEVFYSGYSAAVGKRSELAMAGKETKLG